MSQPSPLTGARQQAQALAGSGDPGGARAVLENALAMGRFNLGKDDPEVLATALQLAQLLLTADDPAAARRVLEEAYSDGHWRLGDDTPVMVLISYEIGVAAEELGNRLEARKAYTRVVEHGTAVLGRDHWTVSRAHAYLGEPAEPGTVRIEMPPPPRVSGPPLPPPPSFAAPATDIPPPAPAEPTAPLYHQAPAPTYFHQTPEHQAPEHQASEHRAPEPAPSRELAFYPAPPSTPFDPPREVGRGAPTEPVNQGYELQHRELQHQELQHRLFASPATPVRQDQDRSAYARKAPALFAVIAAVLAAVIAVVALVVVLAQRGDNDDPQPRESDVPALGGPAPTDLKVTSSGSSITVTWTDPAHGTVPFVVSGGQRGEVLKPMGQVTLGVTSLTLNGLNAGLDYCFAVVAVYSSNKFASSPQECTSRVKSTPRPSTS